MDPTMACPDLRNLIAAAAVGAAHIERGDTRYAAGLLKRGWIVKIETSSGLHQIQVPVIQHAARAGLIAHRDGKIVLTPAGKDFWRALFLPENLQPA